MKFRMLTIVIGLSLAGCGSDTDPSPPVTETTMPSTAPATMFAPATQSGPAAREAGFLKLAADPGTSVVLPDGTPGKRTASGLAYADETVGTGAMPQLGQRVAIRYTARHVDKNGKPAAEFESNTNPKAMVREWLLGEKEAMIVGVQEGLLTMRPGGKRRLFIPADLAYGAVGAAPAVEPNEPLYYEVQLVEVSGEPLQPDGKEVRFQGASKLTGPKRTLPDGLLIEDLREGAGPVAGKEARVAVHYMLWLSDGKLLESSRAMRTPQAFNLGKHEVIAGWEEGIPGMKVGGLRRLTIPPQLGYGAKGSGLRIPPNSTLVFEVELLMVDGKTTPPTAPNAPASRPAK